MRRPTVPRHHVSMLYDDPWAEDESQEPAGETPEELSRLLDLQLSLLIVGYSLRCSITRRTARALSSSSILFGMSCILPTQKDAASNLGRFTLRGLATTKEPAHTAAPDRPLADFLLTSGYVHSPQRQEEGTFGCPLTCASA